MTTTRCIPEDRLRRLLLGELTEPEAQPLEEHLLVCQQCVARTRSLQLEDTLVSALHRAGAASHAEPQSSAVEQLVERLADRSQLGTRPSLLDETQAPSARPARGVADLVARFESAAGPDELGRLGGFRVLKLLGQGGMGAVFLAEDIQLRRPVALKLMRPNQTEQPGAVERFMREARAAAAVRHDHVVTIYQVGQAGGVPFIAQELLEGETLDDRLKREGSLKAAEAIRIGREIAGGLAAAHEQGLLHRDVKPSNVWLESRGSGVGSRVKILDFGLARHQHDGEQLTHSGTVLGTPAFMSPEQAQGKEVDARTDLFSVGGVLYRAVTGRLPFPGTDVLSILRSLAVDEPPQASSLNPEVPAELSRLISDLLQKDREQRPNSAAEVARRLAEIEASWNQPARGSAKPPARSIFMPTLLAGAIAALIALGVFLTVKTPHGEITVEFGDDVKRDDVKIEVERDGKVKIADSRRGWTIDVQEGQYNVQLAGGNDKLTLNERSVTVVRNKKAHLKVTLKPPADADRVAANAVLSLDGNVAVRVGGAEQTIQPGTTLPAKDFELLRLQVSKQPQLTDAVLERLTEARNLSDVQLYLVPITDASLEYLARLPKLERLMLTQTRVTGSGLKHLRGRTGLKTLGVDGGPFDDRGLAYVADLPNLELLWLGSTQITSSGLVHLKNLKRLKYLSVGETQVGDEGLPHLQGLSGLKRLVLSGTKVTDAGLAHLQDFQNLEELEFAHSGLSDAGLAMLAAKGPKSIRELRIWTTQITDDGLVHLKSLPRLSILYLGWTKVSDAGLATLKELKNLSEIQLTGTQLTAEGIESLKKSLPGCHVITDAAGASNPKSASPNPQSPPPLIVAPFTAAEAKTHQQAWADYLGLPVECRNSIGMKFVLIPPGEFTMGNSPEQAAAVAALHPSDGGWTKPAKSTAPAHRVRLTQPYYLGLWEVMQRQYKQVTGNNPSQFSAGGARRPVESIAYADVARFCNLLSQRERLQPQYYESSDKLLSPPADGYRVPTEAQWEFACRAGTTTAWYTGDDERDLAKAAWYAPTAGRTSHDAGQLQPNPFGLFDMHGNVWEWCQDWYGENTYAGRSAAVSEDPTGPDVGAAHILRGGTWGAEAADTRSATRAAPFANRSNGYGFRVLLPVAGMRKLFANLPAIVNSQSLAERMAAMPPLEVVGDWQIQDGCLIQGKIELAPYGSLRFGDPEWTDYDLRARVTLGPVWANEFSLVGRADGYNRCEYILAGFGNKTNRDLLVFAAGEDGWRLPTRRFLTNQSLLKPGSTHVVELRMRGAKFTTFLDGVQVSTTEEGRLLRGRAGLSSYGATRFDQIEVRAPDGTLLWQGLPDVEVHVPRAEPRAGDPPRAASPFTAAEAKAHQEAWARHLKVPVEYTNSLGMKLRLIPPGEFSMGSTADEIAALVSQWDPSDLRGPECLKSGGPQHRVILTRPIYAGVLEVTQQQYTEIMGANPAAFSKDGSQRAVLEKAGITDTTGFPVESVSWLDASEFCQKLSIREKMYYGGSYRLPSEAEWEFACRAGTTSPFHTGDGETAAVAAGWFRGNSGVRPHAGGELAANAFGLSDLHGNVWEWVLDRRDTSFYARNHPAAAIDPQSLTAPTTERVLRGGNWRGIAEIGRADFRDGRDEFHRHYDYGFRIWLPVDSLLASAEKEPGLLKGQLPPVPAAPAAPASPGAQGAAFEGWLKHVATLAPAERAQAVGHKLQELNAGFDGQVEPQIAGNFVRGLKFCADQITNVAPVQALPELETLTCCGTPGAAGGPGALADLGPLAGMKLQSLDVSWTSVRDLAPLAEMPLKGLHISGTLVEDLTPLQKCPLVYLYARAAKLTDLAPLQGIRLEHLDCGDNRIATLAPLANMPLQTFCCRGTAVTDLSPLQGAPLWILNCAATEVVDLSPVQKCPLKWLECDFRAPRDAALLRKIPTLEKINGQPASDVLR